MWNYPSAQGLRPNSFKAIATALYVDNKRSASNNLKTITTVAGCFWIIVSNRWTQPFIQKGWPTASSMVVWLPVILMARTGGIVLLFWPTNGFHEYEIYHGMEHGDNWRWSKNNFPVDYTLKDSSMQPSQCLWEEPTAELRTVYQPTEHIYFNTEMHESVEVFAGTKWAWKLD